MNKRLAELGVDSFWLPPKDATPEVQAEFEERMAKMLVPDEEITAWVDVGDTVDLKWEAIRKHVTQICGRQPVHALRHRGLADLLGQGGVHPARVAGRDVAAGVGPVRRDQLRRLTNHAGWHGA